MDTDDTSGLRGQERVGVASLRLWRESGHVRCRVMVNDDTSDAEPRTISALPLNDALAEIERWARTWAVTRR